MIIRPEGAGAVMSSRAPALVETDTDLMALYRRLEFFPTPPWATRAGAEVLLEIDPTARVIRDPCCGQLHMTGPLEEIFPEVLPSDVYPYSPNTPIRDWLDASVWDEEDPDCDWIFANPPFPLAEDFVVQGLRRARAGVAILQRLAFLEGGERHGVLAGAKASLTVLAPFSERVPMTLGRWVPKASTATAYAWFFWKRDAAPRAPRFIGPGTKARLTKKDDAMRYGWKEPNPLFDINLVDEEPHSLEG